MFVIWGNRTFRKIVAQTPVKYTCGNCNNVHPFVVMKISKWFTLFFIPIFPYDVKYFEMCPVCNRGNYTSKTAVTKMIEQCSASNVLGSSSTTEQMDEAV